jgi:chromate transporter
MEAPRLGAITALFFRSGSFTLGGGSTIQAVLHLEVVERRGWLSSAEFGLIYGLARFTPGTNILACSAALAWRLGGWPAAVAAVVAVSLPASLLLLALLDGYERVRALAWVGHAISGALVAVVALIAVSSWKLVQPFAAKRRWVRIGLLTGGATAALASGALSPIAILGVAIVAGLLLDRLGVA